MSDYNLKVVRGRDFKWDGTIMLLGTAVDLTGATVALYAKRRASDADADLAFQCSSPSDGINITTPSSGQIELTISAAKTAGLVESQDETIYLDYEIVYRPTGKKWKVLGGTIEVTPSLFSLV
jgi:hypothetical protein